MGLVPSINWRTQMLKGDLIKLKKLAEKNRKKSESMDKNPNEKKRERINVDKTLESDDALKLFNEMKERPY